MGQSQELPREGRHGRWAAGKRRAQCRHGLEGQAAQQDTHESSTDPDARRFKKSRKSPAILCYHGHILMENRSGLVAGAVVGHADGLAERASALRLLDCVPGTHTKTGHRQGYDTRDFVSDCRARTITPHVARNDDRHGGSAIDGRTSRHTGYRTSQVIHKRIEEHFGWVKRSVGSGRRFIVEREELAWAGNEGDAE
jgi:hypothetical protein